jgi:CheY-like chemotaxis protein
MKIILVIDDCVEICENISELLVLEGYEVISAASAKTGLILARRNIPSVILCDIMMPEMGGYEVFRQLRNSELTRNIPFIFLSSVTEKKDIRIALNAGVDGYIQKPFDEAILFSTIKHCLKIQLQVHA